MTSAVGAKLSENERYEITVKATRRKHFCVSQTASHTSACQDAKNANTQSSSNYNAKQNIYISCTSHVWSSGNKVHSAFVTVGKAKTLPNKFSEHLICT